MNEHDSPRFVGFERGEIVQKKGGPLYRVKSLTRNGIVSRWIKAIPQENDSEFSIGDKAYFFMFEDGRGMVLGPVID